MWYKIERNLNSFIISNTGSNDLYITLYFSEKCDIDVNFITCITETKILKGEEYVFSLPTKDGLYKLIITDKIDNYKELFIPQYLQILSSLIEDIDYVLCGCNCENCEDCSGDDKDLLSVVLKILSFLMLNKDKYKEAIFSSSVCIECDIIEASLCNIIHESVNGNYQNKNLFKKLIAFYYLVFYYTDYKIENNLETIKQRYHFKEIYPCIKKLGLSITCIEYNWKDKEECDCDNKEEITMFIPIHSESNSINITERLTLKGVTVNNNCKRVIFMDKKDFTNNLVIDITEGINEFDIPLTNFYNKVLYIFAVKQQETEDIDISLNLKKIL